MSYDRPKFSTFLEEVLWASEMKKNFIGPPKPPKEIDVQHEVYPYIGTSDKQRNYLKKRGIKHQRKDGSYK